MKFSDMFAELFEAAVSDVVAASTTSPPTAVAAKIASLSYRSYVQQREQAASQILVSEIRSGRVSPNELDKNNLFALVAQFENAVRVGAANRNLKLLAELVVNGSTKPIPFEPDEVASISRYIADLDPEELILLGELQRQTENFASYAEGEENKKIAINTMLEKALVPSAFKTKDELMMVATSLQRTGLVVLPSVWGGNRIDATARFHKLARLVNLSATFSEKE